MSKIAVVFNSKYGYTKKYAEWLSQDLQADLLPLADATAEKLSAYDLVIYGGGLYAGAVSGISLFAKARSQNLIVFTVGLSNPETTDYTEVINRNKLSETKVFHLRGGLNREKLSFLHKTGLSVLKKALSSKKPEKLTPEERGILEACAETVDFTDISAIKPITDYVRGM